LLLQIAAYETLLRRLILRVPGAALLSVAAFNFMTQDALPEERQYSSAGRTGEVPIPYYGSGGLMLWVHLIVKFVLQQQRSSTCGNSTTCSSTVPGWVGQSTSNWYIVAYKPCMYMYMIYHLDVN
jgi:hypothetical protein